MGKSNHDDRIATILQTMHDVECSPLSVNQYFQKHATPYYLYKKAIAERGLQGLYDHRSHGNHVKFTQEMKGFVKAELLQLDETPWYEHGRMRWLWVVISVTAQIAVYHVGSRKKTVLLDLVTEVCVGWLVSDGYLAYRSYEKRQRCVAHLIRKAVALAEGVNAEAAQLGDWLLNELRGLIHTMAEGGEAAKRRCFPILERLKRACLIGREGPTPKMQALAKEILNDWEAIVAFVKHPDAALPPTNNEAERALRHAVISRRISQGTRTSEGSRAYGALLSVIETCRLRRCVPWDYIAEVIALARQGIAPPPIPSPV